MKKFNLPMMFLRRRKLKQLGMRRMSKVKNLKPIVLNYFFPLIYGSDSSKELEKVKKMCEDLIFEYQASDNMVSSECIASTLDDPSVEKQNWEQGYMKYVMENASTNGKSEFVSYLEDGILMNKENNELLKNFDILGWWKQNGVKYPTLQKIARDFLAIPISTVASESAFSTSGRVVTPQRSRLKEDTLEALMCSQSWFRTEMQGYSKILASFECVDEDMDDDDEEMSQT